MGDKECDIEEKIRDTSKESNDESICGICLEPFTDINERYNVLLVDTAFQSIHEAHSSNFHEPCIIQWMEEKNEPTCPFCRKTLKRDEESFKMRLRRNCLSGNCSRRDWRSYLKLLCNCCLCSVLNPILWIVLYWWTNQELTTRCNEPYDSYCHHISRLHKAAAIILLIELILVCSFRQRS